MNDKLPSTITVKPRIGGWLFAYIFFSIPGLIFSWLALILLIVIVAGGLSAISTKEQSAFEENQLEFVHLDGKAGADSKILVYDLEGAIYSGGKNASLSDLNSSIFTDKINSDFAKIKADSSIKAVVFKVNTPGGESIAAEEIGDAIDSLVQAKNQPKAIFYWDGIVASGGVFLTTKTKNNYIIANPYGQSGSIGSIISLPDLQGLYDKIGIKWKVYKSAPSKDYGSDNRDPSETENKFIQSKVDKVYNRFVDVVSTGRGIERNKVLDFANGFVYDNDESLKLKLIDELGGLDKAYTQMASLQKLSDYEVVTLKSGSDFWSELLQTKSQKSSIFDVFGLSKLESSNKFLKSGQLYMMDPNFSNSN